MPTTDPGVKAKAADRPAIGWPRMVAAIVLLNLLLVLPDRPSQLQLASVIRVAPELPIIVLALVLTWGWPRTVLRWAAVAFISAAIVFSVADLVMRVSLDRPFKPLLDLHLASAGWNLLSAAVGPFRSVVILISLAGGLILGIVVAIRATGILTAAGGAGRRRTVALGAGAAAAAIATLALADPARVRFEAAVLLASHAEQIASDLEVRRAFAVDRTPDLFADVPRSDLLASLGDRDVLLIFVESYGRSAIEDDRYRLTMGPALADLDAALAGIGAGIRSAWLTSPVSGGQSWLAHGTLLSGLWLDSQRRYDTLLTTSRRTLIHAFDDAGWRTLAVMPAIAQAWPQGAFFGYDRIYAATDLGYAGDPFNWVTMPDQFTLSAFQRLELGNEDRRPVMAEIALISSHAPWTPIAEIVPWSDVGDGAIFNRWANEGDPPAVVWQDFDRVRTQYRLAVEYSLRTVAAYLETYLDEDALVIVLGDHQPAPLITGEDASRDVPIHIISRDEQVLSAFDDWQWTQAADPSDAAPVWRMDEFRDRFLLAFTPAIRPLARNAP